MPERCLSTGWAPASTAGRPPPVPTPLAPIRSASGSIAAPAMPEPISIERGIGEGEWISNAAAYIRRGRRAEGRSGWAAAAADWGAG
jgi:hypothetical protein